MKTISKFSHRMISIVVLSTIICASIIPAYNASAHSTSASGVVHSFDISKPSESGYMDIDFSVDSVGKSQNYLTIPAYYDPRLEDKPFITSVKDQGETNTCWAFSAMSTAESSLIKLNDFDINDIDLSELHLAYYLNNNAYDKLGLLEGDYTSPSTDFLSSGGMHYISALSLARWTGVVDEKKHSEFSFQNAYSGFNVLDNKKAYGINEALLKNAYFVSTKDKNDIKQLILKYGSAMIGFYFDEEYLSSVTSGYCYIPTSGKTQSANHEACIVGWNDSYSKENFPLSKPKNNGAWLVKNSWGEGFGSYGYIWLSYEDASLLEDDACFLEFSSVNQYDYNYQYDGTSNPTSNYSDGTDPINGGFTGGGYMSNIFTSQYNDYLNAVSFVTYDPNVNYSVEIYTDLQSRTDPLSGKRALPTPLKGTKKYAGIHTIPLPESIQLTKGQRFSVVVRLFKDNASERVILPCDKTESSLSWISFTNTAISNQSFFSTNMNNWVNVAKDDGINFRIKAFTSHLMIGESFDMNIKARKIELNKDYLTLSQGNSAVLTVKFTPENTTNKKVRWASADESIAIISQAGRIIALKPGTTTITVVSEDGNFSSNCTLNIKDYNDNLDPIPTNMVPDGIFTIEDAMGIQDGDVVDVIGQITHKYSSKSGGEKNYIIIEDEINGEAHGLLLVDDSGLLDKYDDGQVVIVSGKITNYKGLREIKEIEKVEPLEECEIMPAQEVTISRLRSSKADDYLNELIVIRNVTLGEHISDGYTSISDSTGSINIYNAEEYSSDIKAGDIVDIYCVFSIYENTYQLRTGSSACYIKRNGNPPISTDTDKKQIFVGDVDLDGSVTMSDVTSLQKYIACLIELDDLQLSAADVNGDLEINLVDVTDIQKYIADLIDMFDAGEFIENEGNEDDLESIEELKQKIKKLLDNIEKFKDSFYNNDDGYYTADSFLNFTDAYRDAIAIYDDEYAQIDELEYAYNQLNDAIDNLEKANP
ncbi:MAG: lectin like domain-containing protein [Clostridia bacterium]|nr:lectin like domain-containing protein [Clostridia bacterium]